MNSSPIADSPREVPNQTPALMEDLQSRREHALKRMEGIDTELDHLSELRRDLVAVVQVCEAGLNSQQVKAAPAPPVDGMAYPR